MEDIMWWQVFCVIDGTVVRMLIRFILDGRLVRDNP